jgi:hypothetical protein
MLPKRQDSLNPSEQPGYLPFGHTSERCQGQHMVMPLAERLLDILRNNGLAVSLGQTTADVPLAGLRGVFQVNIVRQ